MRHTLNVKQKPLNKETKQTKNFDSNIFETLEAIKTKNDFEEINTKDEFVLASYIQKKYSLDIFSLCKQANLKEKEFGLRDNKIRKLFLHICLSNIPLNYSVTDNLIKYFNSKEHPRFSNTRINKNSNTYLQTCIVVSYVLSFLCKNNISKIKTAIDRLEEFGLQNQKFRYIKKWTLLDFLCDYREKNYLEDFLCDDVYIFKNSVYKRKAKYEKAQAKWKSIFISFYADKEKGKVNYAKYENRLVAFLDNLIDRIKQEQRNLCGFKLTVPTNRMDSQIEDAPILQEYLMFIKDSLGNGMLVKDIVDEAIWKNFVDHRMRGEYGYHSFWKKLDKIQ